MKKHTFIILFLVVITRCSLTQAQIVSVSAGTDLTVSSGTPFTADGITFIPASNYTLSGITMTRNTVLSHPATGTYISRVYQFSDATAPFTGTVQINYQTSELNGLTPSELQLNVHDGNSWQAVASTTNDITNHYILSALSGKPLNELTLASIAAVLPLTWLSFTATPQNNQALLQWSTASEQNTRDYVILHSTAGNNWHTIGSLPAAGNSSAATNYRYVHAYPVTGKNYYRIQQTDLDGKTSFSETRSVLFNIDRAGFSVVTNPVNNGVLKIQADAATDLSFYSAGGVLLWKKRFDAGGQSIDISGYAKGLYYITDQKNTVKVIAQ